MSAGKTQYKDEYQILETEQDASSQFEKWQAQDNTYCAAYALITKATEPHWTD